MTGKVIMTDQIYMTESSSQVYTTTSSITTSTTTSTTTTTRTTTSTTTTTTTNTQTTSTGTTSTRVSSKSQFCSGSGSSEVCNCLKSDSNGSNYIGHVSQTKSHPTFGVRPCKDWSLTRFSPIDGRNHNYCRNPNGSRSKPWCVVEDGYRGSKIGYCDVEKCNMLKISTTTGTRNPR